MVHYLIHKFWPPVPILRSIQSMSWHPSSWRSILILRSHLRLGLPSGLFFQISPPKPCIHLDSPVRATCPSHLILLGFNNRETLGEVYRSLSSSLCSFLHSSIISLLLGTNILLDTPFTNNLSLCSSLNARDQVSHSYIKAKLQFCIS